MPFMLNSRIDDLSKLLSKKRNSNGRLTPPGKLRNIFMKSMKKKTIFASCLKS